MDDIKFYKAPNIDLISFCEGAEDEIIKLLEKKLQSLETEINQYLYHKDRFLEWYKYESDQKHSKKVYWLFYKHFSRRPGIYHMKDITWEIITPENPDYKFFSEHYSGDWDRVVKEGDSFKIKYTRHIQPHLWFHKKFRNLSEERYNELWGKFLKISKLFEFNLDEDWEQKLTEKNRIKHVLTTLQNRQAGKVSLKENREELLNYAKGLSIIYVAQCLGIPIKKAGSGKWNCCCVFHDEKSPSLFFTERMNIFKCFGCGEKGDQIGLYMKYMNCDFNTALDEMSKL